MNEESPQKVAVSTKVHKVKIDERFKDEALQTVRDLVRGNGIPTEDLTLASFEGELLHFEAHTDLIVTTKFAKKTVPGRMTGPVNVANEIALQESIAREYMLLFADADTQRKIRDIALKRDDQGFGTKDVVMQIPFWKKEFVIFEPCHTCHKTGNIQCRSCAGKGSAPCNRCAGSGKTACSFCHGTRLVNNSNGQKVQCNICHGQGHVMCGQCQQTGRMQCRTCATKGVTQCPNCQGNAWASHLTIVTIEAKTKFEYPQDELPEKICAMIESYGDKIREHAKIHLMEAANNALQEVKAEEMNAEEIEQRQKILHIPIFYEVSLPYGHIEFDIKGKSYYTFLFGIKGALSHVSPFLDDLIKDGLRKMQDAVDGRGDVGANLVAAAKFRAIRRGIFYTSKAPLRKARRLLERDFPFGLSDAAMEEIIARADTALKGLSKRPRQIGLALSGTAMLAMFAAYFMLPLREQLAARLPSAPLQALIDAAVLGGGVYIGAMLIQAYASRALRDLLPKITGAKEKQDIAPTKLAETVYLNIGVGVIAFIAAMEIAAGTGGQIPLWYAMIRG